MRNIIGNVTARLSLKRLIDERAWHSFRRRLALLVAGIAISILASAGLIYSWLQSTDALINSRREDNQRQHLFHLADFGARTVVYGSGEKLFQHHFTEVSEAFEHSQSILTDNERRMLRLILAGLENPARYRADVAKIMETVHELHHKYDERVLLKDAEYLKKFHQLSLYLLLVALLIPGLAVIAGFFLVKDMVSGLRMLVSKIEIMGDGGDPGKVTVDRQDEIGVIAAAIDTMHAKTKAQEIESAINRQLLIEQKKMGDIINLAGGIAHEVGNPLSVLMTNLEEFEPMWCDQSQCKEDERKELQSLFDGMREAIERIEVTIRTISAFPGEVDEDIEAIDINDLVSRITHMVGLDDRTRHIDFNVALSPNVPVIVGPSGKVVLVLFNIIALIAERMHERNGAVSIETSAAKTGVQLSFAIDLPAGSEPRTASMLSEEERSEIIRQLQEHTTVRRILNELNGNATIHLSPAYGSYFVVQLPFSVQQGAGT